MTEPATSIATGGLLGIAALSVFFPHANEPVLLAAFCGSVIFVLSKTDMGNLLKLVYMAVSFVMGILGADDAAAILSGLLNMLPLEPPIVVSPAIGALFCAVIIIQLLNVAIKTDWARLIKVPQRGGK